MCRLAKQTSNKANLSNVYPGRRFILEKIINHKTIIPFLHPLIVEINVICISTSFQAVSSIKYELIGTISISEFNLTKRLGMCKIKVFASIVVHTSFPLI